MTPLILASESPRRRELLNEAGFTFEVIPIKVSEIPNKNLNVNEQILDIARRKARAAYKEFISSRPGPFRVLTADTEVIFNEAPLGKPQNREDAYRILKLLSGQPHEVKTAVCMIDSRTSKEVSLIETTQIYFKTLSDEEIWTYIDTGEPMDKAGAYGIQGLGRKFVDHFDGPYDNVVGLPINVVKTLLKELDNS
ncbi:MAG: Maf family protein [Bdellovibrio sp.]